MDAIKRYFWLYLAFVFLMVVCFHTCVKAIDQDAKAFQDKINKHLAETKSATYVTERN